MKNYRDFSAEDFLSDEFFMEWVLTPNPEHTLFWDKWLAENADRAPEVRRATNIIKALYVKPNDKQLTDADVKAMADHFLQNTNKPLTRIFNLPVRWIAAAAVLILALVSTLIISKQYNNPAETTSATTAVAKLINIKNTEQTSKMLKLSDGSIIVLKAHSELSYSPEFDKTQREVFLKGEGFFEVAKNPNKPFLVHAGNMITRVLGTSFTVSAYHGDDDFKVVVNTGRVQVYDRRKTADGSGYGAVILTPNQQVIRPRGLASLKTSTLKEPLLLSPELAKKEFLFTDAPLPAIIAKLEQAYGATINYDKTKYADVTVTASLSKLPLDEKVRVICKAIDARCEFKDGNIWIR